MGRYVYIAVAMLLFFRRAEANPAPAATASEPDDAVTVAEMALEWAVVGGISDFHLVKDPSLLIVADFNLPKNAVLKVAGHKVSLLPLQDIQTMADDRGDFLYFRFAPFIRHAERIDVPISLVWAVGAKSTTIYMSGGGATLNFERQNGKWILLPVTEHWMSIRKPSDGGCVSVLASTSPLVSLVHS
ncbi:MAG: hypothetical protein HY270_18890 [Deltaproteobacteria bacterium]|nr:hypothetical protein [Deltaproteobacteria bacterium]